MMSVYHTHIRRFATSVLILLAFAMPAIAQGNYNNNGSYQQFYDELSPYGEWIDDPQNGYVWIPDAGDDFRPYYTNGYWANTEYGNTWVSNYDWGWAPFHYGRWTYSNFYGWIWIPGNEWGPAWVSWRSGGGSYGWAPLGPGVSINLSFGNNYYVPDYWWVFAPQQYLMNPRFHQYSYGPRYNTNYIRQTTIINNTYVYNNRTYIAGPRRNEIERATGRPVRVMNLRDRNQPSRSQLRGNNLNIYRPAINQSEPRADIRPRQFQRSEQAISTPPREMSARPLRNMQQQPATNGSLNMQMDRNIRSGADRSQRLNELQQSDTRRPQIQQPSRSIDRVETQPTRPAEIRQQRNEWNNNQMPQRSPVQQMQQPSRPMNRIEAAPTRQSQPIQRQMQAQPQSGMQRPVILQRQPQMQRSMDMPRAAPQRQAPATQPSRMEQARPSTGDRPGAR